MKFEDGDIVKGEILYALVVEDKANKLNLEIGFKATEKVLGTSPDDPCETIKEVEAMTRLYLDDVEEEDEKKKMRRGIARDTIEFLTGVKLEDTWKGDQGYQRLAADHPASLAPMLNGKNPVLFKAKAGNTGGVMWNVFTPRKKPVAKSLAEIKATMRSRQS